mgnify:CR=1 FL=1
MLAFRVDRRYLVRTDHGDVLVTISSERGGLDPELVELQVPEDGDRTELTPVPLRAFGAKMVEIVEAQGGELPGGPALQRMLIQEKATSDLNRIERWARSQQQR